MYKRYIYIYTCFYIYIYDICVYPCTKTPRILFLLQVGSYADLLDPYQQHHKHHFNCSIFIQTKPTPGTQVQFIPMEVKFIWLPSRSPFPFPEISPSKRRSYVAFRKFTVMCYLYIYIYHISSVHPVRKFPSVHR